MKFVNQTRVAAGWTMGFDRDGRELVVVAIKATFTIPLDGGEPLMAEQQRPLVEADQFTGQPGLSAPLYESDYAHRRPICDVVLNGSAYAPANRRATRLDVGLRVGSMTKILEAVGNRFWDKGVWGIRVSDPQPFDVMPISYDNAFGGMERSKSDPEKARTFPANPVGRGYLPSKEDIDGKPLPNTEEFTKPVTNPNGAYRPMSFGSIGRNWVPRVGFAGTYDQHWLDNRAPFWPDDFDDRYFQSAPPDQQIPYPNGGEQVVLKNLTPNGTVSFRLPIVSMPVWFLPQRGRDTRVDSVIDTIVIEPDRGVFTLTWRAVLPMRRSCFDMKEVIAGEMSEAWQRMRKYGSKPYYKGLSQLVRARRRGR
jgi:hypothetical protein